MLFIQKVYISFFILFLSSIGWSNNLIETGAAKAEEEPKPFLLNDLSLDWANSYVDWQSHDEEVLEKLKSEILNHQKQYKDWDFKEVISLIDQYVNSSIKFKELELEKGDDLVFDGEGNKFYKLSDILSLNKEKNQIEAENELEQSLLDSLEKKETALVELITKTKDEYLELDKKSEDKSKLGLLWVTQWLKLQNSNIEKKIKEHSHNKTKLRIQFNKDELTHAQRYLIASNQDLESIQKQKTKTTEELAKLQQYLDKEQDSFVEDGDPEKNKLLYRLHNQKVNKISAEIHQSELNLIEIVIKEQLFKIIRNPDRVESKDIKKILNESDTKLGEMKVWLNESRNLTAKDSKLIESLETDPEQFKTYQNVIVQRKKMLVSTEAIFSEISQQIERTSFLSKLTWDQIIEIFGDTAAISASLQNQIDYTWEQSKSLLTSHLFEVNQTPINILDLLNLCFILLITWAISKALRQAFLSLTKSRSGMNVASLHAFSRIINYFILSTGFIVGLSSIGIDVTKFALIASALSVGIGFGMQNMINNFVSGLMLLFERSLKVGDFVELESGVSGVVSSINMRSTIVTTNDNIDMVIPNSQFVNGRVTNWTMREAFCRIHVPFGVAYGTDKNLVEKAILEAAERVSYTLNDVQERAPQVWLVNFGASSLDFELVIWIKPFAVKFPAKVKATYSWEIDTSLREYNIEIPFPQRDLHIRSSIPFSSSKNDESSSLFASDEGTRAS